MVEVRKGDLPVPRVVETWPVMVLTAAGAVLVGLLCGAWWAVAFLAGAAVGSAGCGVSIVRWERKVAAQKRRLVALRYRDRDGVRRGIAGPGTARLLRDLRDEGEGR